jgi:hypothetical protein
VNTCAVGLFPAKAKANDSREQHQNLPLVGKFIAMCLMYGKTMPLPLSSCTFGLLLGDSARLNASDSKHLDAWSCDPAVVIYICNLVFLV